MAAPCEKVEFQTLRNNMQTEDRKTQSFRSSLNPGGRSFYSLPEDYEAGKRRKDDLENKQKLLNHVHDMVIGNSATFSGPFGIRSVVYCDYTASGQALRSFEDFIQGQVLPMYGNVHTTTTVTALQSTLFRHEARDIIRNAVRASEHDAVIFVGSGCTAAIHKLVNALDLQMPPVVFTSPFEHHSNILPWKELGSTVIRIPQSASGLVDTKLLEGELKKWQGCGRQLIGCFSAASNITGILSDTVGITVLLHRYNALSFWDYATAGPYVDITMNPVINGSDQAAAQKDAIFLSPHKFVGGVDTPGILVAKKCLFKNRAPNDGGGGSVFFVSREHHRYLKQIEMREEGGTPSIVGAIRAGLTFQLKEAVGSDTIMKIEEQLCQRAVKRWSSCPNLLLLGSLSVPRLPIFSFLVRHPETRQMLHHNFVCAVLNDLFGIQARGGCACAGPYAQDVLGIDEDLAQQYENLLLEDKRLDRIHLRRYNEYSDREVLRPGFVRLNLAYFMKDECVKFVLDAVAMVAEHGWKLLPQYMFNPETGEWKQRHHQVFQDRRWLGSISYASGEMVVPTPPAVKPKGALPGSYQECLQIAQQVFTTAEKKCRNMSLPDQTLLFQEQSELLRWFLLPSEALNVMQNRSYNRRVTPFEPPTYPLTSKFREVTTIEGAVHSCEGGSHIHLETPYSSDGDPISRLDGRGDATGEICNGDLSRDNLASKNAAECAVPTTCAVSEYNDDEENTNSKLTESGKECPMKMNDSQKKLNDKISSLAMSEDERNLDTKSNISKEGNSVATNRDLELCSEAGSDNYRELSEVTISTGDRIGDIVKDDRGQRSSDHDQNERLADPAPNLIDRDVEVVIVKDSESLSSCTTHGVGGEDAVMRDAELHNVISVHGIDREGDINESEAVKVKFHSPPKKIFKPAMQAVEEYQMIEDGDRLLVCLSGGKDSLSLLHTIRQYQFLAKKKGIHFEFGAVTVDPQTSSFDPSPLKGYLADLGVPYFYEEQCIIEQAATLEGGCDSICSFCSRIKRGRIYACARKEGYNVLAMGQHLDDLAESFFMSVFHNGLLRTMKANYLVQEGDLRVIRPFVYVREKELREFAQKAKLPVIPENCPACFEAPKERHRTKQLLAAQEILFPRLYQSLLTAMKPLMAKNRTGMESVHRKKPDRDEEDEIQL